MMFDKSYIKRLESLPIKEVAEKLGIKLHNKKCLCFIHEEKTPSLSFDFRKNRWKCFGCGQGGGVIGLVEQYYKIEFNDACEWLSNAFGIAHYQTRSFSTYMPKPQKQLSFDNQPDYEIYNWLFNNLTVTENVRSFIKKREYPERVIEEFNLKGLDDCDVFFKKCREFWGDERLLKCGLAKEYVDKETGEISCRFVWWTNTLFFPFYNSEGNIIYIQGRTLNPKFEKKYKYVNLNDIKTIPFNIPILNTLNVNDDLVITEGITDCISCCLMRKKSIGIIGAFGFKKEYIKYLKDYHIIVIPDNDSNKTGERFSDKIRADFLSIGNVITVLHLDNCYKDISEYYMKEWGHGEID